MSGPVFMYRKGEARMFASLEDVPAGEGWQDTPPSDMHVAPDGDITFGTTEPVVEPTPEPVEPTEPAVEPAPVIDEADIEIAELDALRARAAELGIEVDGRWGIKKLTKLIAEAEAPSNGDGA